MTDFVQTFTIRGTHIHVQGQPITSQEAGLYLQQALSSKLPPSKHYKLLVGNDGVVWMEALTEGVDQYSIPVVRLPRRSIPYTPHAPVDYDALLSTQDVIAE